MASLVMRAPSAAGAVGIQPIDVRSLYSKPSTSSVYMPKAQLILPWVFREKCELGFPPLQQAVHRMPWIAMSVNDEATAETTGGILDVEDEASLEQQLQEAGGKLVVLDISTKTCGPCKLIYPKLVKMSKDYPDAVFLKIMGDLNSETRALMRKWGVRAVPSFRFYRNGELIHSHNGANEDELRSHFLVHYEETAKV